MHVARRFPTYQILSYLLSKTSRLNVCMTCCLRCCGSRNVCIDQEGEVRVDNEEGRRETYDIENGCCRTFFSDAAQETESRTSFAGG